MFKKQKTLFGQTDKQPHVDSVKITVAPKFGKMQIKNFVLHIHWENVFRFRYNRTASGSTKKHGISQYHLRVSFSCIQQNNGH